MKGHILGFTLIELIIVILIMSILGLGTVSFIRFSTQGYVDLAERQSLAFLSYIATKKLSRFFREALPNSIRLDTVGTSRCIEWIPIIKSGIYATIPVTAPAAQLTVLEPPTSGSYPNNLYVAVYPSTTDPNQLYQNNNNTAVTASTVTEVDPIPGDDLVDLSFGLMTHQFPLESPQQRFFLIEQPRMLCFEANSIFYYQNYGFQANISTAIAARPTSGNDRQLIVNELNSTGSTFDYNSGSGQLAGRVTVTYHFQSSAEQVLIQEIHVRNVP